MYYSPILFSQIADLNLTQYHDCIIDMKYLNSKEKIIIFSLHSMGYLIKLEQFLDNVKKPFIIISAMEDTQLPLEIDEDFMFKIKYNSFFKHWFSINKTIPNDDKFTSIPYGLNYWTLSTQQWFGENIQNYDEQNSVIENISSQGQHFSKRIPLIYSNFHFNFTDDRHGGWRRKLIDIIPSEIIYYETSVLPRSEAYKNMSNYTFVVSPFGHGFDCIRTFEALCLGCIVIMKKSFLDIIYQDLPVLLVDEWSDINETLLKDTLIHFSNKQFNYDKLKMDYYIKLVNSKF
jgi:hypothetical protein